MKFCKVVHVSGKVQGVFFRASTQQQAIALGLTGYVRNLVDGDVEVVACGEKEPLDELLTWLHNGPKPAEVHKVQTKDIEWQQHSHFSIG